MKQLYTILLFLALPATALCQASVGYYPFNSFGLFTVSTNPDKLVWLDSRLQTNSLFEQLSTTFCPMVNVKRTERVNYYVGPGIQINALNAVNGDKILEGYSLHVGVRAAPVANLPNLRVAFELSPSARANFKSGFSIRIWAWSGIFESGLISKRINRDFHLFLSPVLPQFPGFLRYNL